MKFIIQLLLIFTLLSCNLEKNPELNVEKIKIELDSIRGLDQLYRNQLGDLVDKYGRNSKEFREKLNKQNEIDSTNLIYVENLIKDYGKYPGSSLVGHSSKDIAFLVLQHSSSETRLKYLDIILEASKDKELNKSDVSLYYDRVLIEMGEKQIYGTQMKITIVKDSLTGKEKHVYSLFPIKDTTNIDSLRLWNGHLSLEEQLNSYGLSRWN